MLDELLDRLNQLVDIAECAPANSFFADLAEPSLDQVQPRTAGGREVYMESPMPLQPLLYVGMLMGRIVVHDQVQIQLGWRLLVDQFEKLDPLLMPVPLHACPNYLSLSDLQRGEQCCRAIAFVVVGHRATSPFMDRKTFLCAIQG